MPDDGILQESIDDARFRQLYEFAEQIGITTPLTKEKFFERYKAWEKGIPADDEFATLITWLGKCELIHKLDQEQIPLSSKELYQVPDFLAVFNLNGERIPVLIEVKSHAEISLSPKRFEKYKRYADLLHLPLLIAWKYQQYRSSNIIRWVLFDLGALTVKKGNSNYKISFETAFSHNLLGLLAGEFIINIKAGVGLNFRMKLIGDKSHWHLMKKSGQIYGQVTVFWSDGYGNEIPTSQISPELLTVLTCVPSLSEFKSNDNEEDIIVQSFTLPNDTPLFTQEMLPILLTETKSLPKSFRWRNLVKDGMLPTSADVIYKAILNLQNENIIDLMKYQLPDFIPSFLQNTQFVRQITNHEYSNS